MHGQLAIGQVPKAQLCKFWLRWPPPFFPILRKTFPSRFKAVPSHLLRVKHLAPGREFHMENNPRDGARLSPSESSSYGQCGRVWLVWFLGSSFTRQQWEGVLDCTDLGPICMQYALDSDPLDSDVTVIGQVKGSCLNCLFWAFGGEWEFISL